MTNTFSYHTIDTNEIKYALEIRQKKNYKKYKKYEQTHS